MDKKRFLPVISVLLVLFAGYNLWFWISEPSFEKNSYGYYVFLNSKLRKVPVFAVVDNKPRYRYIQSKADTPATYALVYQSKDTVNSIIQSYTNYFSHIGYNLVPSTLLSNSQEFVSDNDYFVVKTEKSTESDFLSVSVSFMH